MYDNDHRIYSRCPTVRVEDGPWCRWTDLSGGAFAMGLATFHKSVEWVRETRSGVDVTFVGGDSETTDSEYNDHYGFGTSVREVVTAARCKAKRFAAGPGTAVVVEAVCTIYDHPRIPTVDRRHEVIPSFYAIPSDWLRPDDAWLKDVQGHVAAGRTGPLGSEHHPAHVARIDVGRLVVWSSRHADGSPEAEGLLDEAIASLVDGIPAAEAERLRDGWATWRGNGCKLD